MFLRPLKTFASLALVLAVVYYGALWLGVDESDAGFVAGALGVLFFLGGAVMVVTATIKESKYRAHRFTGPPLPLGLYLGSHGAQGWKPNQGGKQWGVALVGPEQVLLSRCSSRQPSGDFWTDLEGEIALFHRESLQRVVVTPMATDDEERAQRLLADAALNHTVGAVLGTRTRTITMGALIHVETGLGRWAQIHTFGIPESAGIGGFLSGAVEVGADLVVDGAADGAVVHGVPLQVLGDGEESDPITAATRLAAAFLARAAPPTS